MTINNEQFIKRITEQSGLSEEQVTKELNDFIELSSGVMKGSPLTIEGLGTFRLKKGRLSFETDPKLAVEINYKYAGMLPIEVKKGYQIKKEEIDDASSDENSNQENISDRTSVEIDEKIAIGKVREPKKDEVPVKAEPVIKVEDKPKAEVVETETSSTKVDGIEGDSDVEKSVEIETTENKQNEIASTKAEKSENNESKELKTPIKPDDKKTSGSNTTLFALIAAAIIIVAVTWFLSQKSSPVEKEQTLVSKTTSPIKEEPKLIEEKEMSKSDEKEKMVQEKPLKEKPSQNTGKTDPIHTEDLNDISINPSQTPTDASKQKMVKEIVEDLSQSSQTSEPYYTVVIYTLSYQSRAEQEVVVWKEKNYDSFMKSNQSKSGKMLYYVCLGKFSSFPDAKNFAQNLPEPFNSKFDVKRLTN